MSKLNARLVRLLNQYDKQGAIVIENDSYSSLLCQKLFNQINLVGNLSKREKLFLIDYMKSGLMTNDEILDYEDLRQKNPQLDLPRVDF